MSCEHLALVKSDRSALAKCPGQLSAREEMGCESYANYSIFVSFSVKIWIFSALFIDYFEFQKPVEKVINFTIALKAWYLYREINPGEISFIGSRYAFLFRCVSLKFWKIKIQFQLVKNVMCCVCEFDSSRFRRFCLLVEINEIFFDLVEVLHHHHHALFSRLLAALSSNVVSH